jgi:lipopolysaccharide biosynthesis glycosyltransferase
MLGKVKDYITKATYYRLFFTEILPDHIDRIIYLDGDMIITGSLDELWNKDLSGYAVGAVTDMSESIHDYARLGYDRTLGYFNAGMLLINLKYWRDHCVLDNFMAVINHHPEKIKYHDQDVLNICFKENKKKLDFKWNFQDGFIYKPEFMEMDVEKYKDQIDKALTDQVVIHYTSAAKPWHKECLNPFKKEFEKYLSMTEWNSYHPVERFPYNHYKKQIGDILRFFHLRPPLREAVYPYII